MRILHVYKGYPPTIGGIEFHVAAVARAQAGSGHCVTVLCVADGRETQEYTEFGVRVIRVGRLGSIASAPFGAGIVTAIRRTRPDITHLHSPFPPGEVAWLAFGRRPMVLSHHADIVRQRVLGRLWSPLQRLVVARADRIIVGSPVLAANSRLLAQHAERVRVIPYGVDVKRFAPTAERLAEASRSQSDDPFMSGKYVIAFVGRLRHYKGLDVLISALVELPDVVLLAVGTGPMGPRLRAEAQAQGVSSRIRWLGDVSEESLPGVLHSADAYVFPSSASSESFGIAMAEAMAAGLPVISTELGTGTSWVNVHGTTGLVVPACDPRRLADAIRKLRNEPDNSAAMGVAARKRAVETFSVTSMLHGIETVYSEVLGAGSDNAAEGFGGRDS